MATAKALAIDWGGVMIEHPTMAMVNYIAKALGIRPLDVPKLAMKRSMVKLIRTNIDEFAKEGYVFDNAFVICNQTVPSHASILSSLHVTDHGALNNFATKIDPNNILISEILRNNGYKTFATVSTYYQ